MSNRGDFYTLERKKTVIYADFPTSFDMNPTTGNLALITNEDAVKRSIRNIVLTNMGERFYDTKKGTGTRGSLFELYDPATLEILRLKITEAIKSYEPRANPFRVIVIDDIQRNAILVRIVFQVVNLTSETYVVEELFQKVR